MIPLFKIIKGIYDSSCVPHLDFMELSKDLIRIRGNKLTISNLINITVTDNTDKTMDVKNVFWQNRLPFCENSFFTGYRLRDVTCHVSDLWFEM